MPQQPQIIRKETITVTTTKLNQYGDLIVVDTAGAEHKIGVKRKNLFSAFQPGADVEIGIAEYNNREYIAEATQTGKHTMVAAAAKIGTEIPKNREDSIESQVAIKEIGECWRAGKLKDEDSLVAAYKSWLSGRLPKSVTTSQLAKPVSQGKATREEPSTQDIPY